MNFLTNLLVFFLILFALNAQAQSLSFDGTDDNVTIHSTGTTILGDYSTPHDLSIDVYFKFTGSPSKKKIVARNGEGTNFFIETTSGHRVKVGVGISGGLVWASEISNTLLVTGTWYHVAMTVDMTNLVIRLYINGVSDETQSAQLIATYGSDSWVTVAAGFGITTAYQHLSSLNTTFGYSEEWGENAAIELEYVRFWNKVLTPAEVTANMNNENTCSDPNVIAMYKFDDGVGGANNAGMTTISDCTGNGHTGTLNNFALTGTSSNFSTSFAFLPVEMTSFEGFAENNSIILNWSTATEEINEGFYVERSANGENWSTLDFVHGHGTTLEPQYYLYEDKNPLQGINYYRLKQIDYDGAFQHSEIIEVEFTTSERVAMKTFPNPASDVLHVRIPNLQDEQQAVVVNTLGQSVRQVNLTAVNSTIKIQDLPKGTYFLRLLNQDARHQNIKFIKQ